MSFGTIKFENTYQPIQINQFLQLSPNLIWMILSNSTTTNWKQGKNFNTNGNCVDWSLFTWIMLHVLKPIEAHWRSACPDQMMRVSSRPLGGWTRTMKPMKMSSPLMLPGRKISKEKCHLLYSLQNTNKTHPRKTKIAGLPKDETHQSSTRTLSWLIIDDARSIDICSLRTWILNFEWFIFYLWWCLLG